MLADKRLITEILVKPSANLAEELANSMSLGKTLAERAKIYKEKTKDLDVPMLTSLLDSASRRFGEKDEGEEHLLRLLKSQELKAPVKRLSDKLKSLHKVMEKSEKAGETLVDSLFKKTSSLLQSLKEVAKKTSETCEKFLKSAKKLSADQQESYEEEALRISAQDLILKTIDSPEDYSEMSFEKLAVLLAGPVLGGKHAAAAKSLFRTLVGSAQVSVDTFEELAESLLKKKRSKKL